MVEIRKLKTRKVLRLDDLENFNGTIVDYGYDVANRLTSLVNKKSDDTVIASYNFPVLDGVGNRRQAVVNEPLAGARTPENTGYAYNEKKNRLETAGNDSFTYDSEGQISAGYNASYTFDYEHRLGSANGNQYFYDGKNNRLKAVRNGVTTYYIYDMNGNVLVEADVNKNITMLYVQGRGLLAMVTPDDEVYSYHFNPIGSTIAITDQSQNIVNKYAYDVFGFVLNRVETIPQPFKYVGQFDVMHEPNGFCKAGARYYDPKTGRWVSEDPIGFDGGDINLSNYVGGNPVNKIDLSGKKMMDLIDALFKLNDGKDCAYSVQVWTQAANECHKKCDGNDECEIKQSEDNRSNGGYDELFKACMCGTFGIYDSKQCAKLFAACMSLSH